MHNEREKYSITKTKKKKEANKTAQSDTSVHLQKIFAGLDRWSDEVKLVHINNIHKHNELAMPQSAATATHI